MSRRNNTDYSQFGQGEVNLFGNTVTENKVTNNSNLFSNNSRILGTIYDNNENTSNIQKCFPAGGIKGGSDILPSSSNILEDYELIYISKDVEEIPIGVCKNTKNKFSIQKAMGDLILYKKNKDFTKTELINIPAISGGGGMGAIPNNYYDESDLNKHMDYYVGHLIAPTNFNDGIGVDLGNGEWKFEKEHSWKLHIFEEFTNRGDFRIHPVSVDNKGNPRSNIGCISPYQKESVEFYHLIKKILISSNDVIRFEVFIEGNFNYTRNICSPITGEYDKRYIDIY